MDLVYFDVLFHILLLSKKDAGRQAQPHFVMARNLDVEGVLAEARNDGRGLSPSDFCILSQHARTDQEAVVPHLEPAGTFITTPCDSITGHRPNCAA